VYTYGIFIKGHDDMIPFQAEFGPVDIFAALKAQMKNDEIIIIDDPANNRNWLVRASEIQVVIFQEPVDQQEPPVQ